VPGEGTKLEVHACLFLKKRKVGPIGRRLQECTTAAGEVKTVPSHAAVLRFLSVLGYYGKRLPILWQSFAILVSRGFSGYMLCWILCWHALIAPPVGRLPSLLVFPKYDPSMLRFPLAGLPPRHPHIRPSRQPDIRCCVLTRQVCRPQR
jgi:hypothetical protein